MRRINHVTSIDGLPENWDDIVVWIWQEDDVPVPDKEKTETAFSRITGLNLVTQEAHKLVTIDHGDAFVTAYRGGWVKEINYEGGRVGCLIRSYGGENEHFRVVTESGEVRSVSSRRACAQNDT